MADMEINKQQLIDSLSTRDFFITILIKHFSHNIRFKHYDDKTFKKNEKLIIQQKIIKN